MADMGLVTLRGKSQGYVLAILGIADSTGLLLSLSKQTNPTVTGFAHLLVVLRVTVICGSRQVSLAHILVKLCRNFLSYPDPLFHFKRFAELECVGRFLCEGFGRRKGIGMGLPIAKETVEDHDESIRIEVGTASHGTRIGVTTLIGYGHEILSQFVPPSTDDPGFSGTKTYGT